MSLLSFYASSSSSLVQDVGDTFANDLALYLLLLSLALSFV